MEITNKEELLAILADDMFQGFDADGTVMIYTIFNTDEYEPMARINRGINEAVTSLMHQRTLEITPIGFVKLALERVELNNAIEVKSFLWQAGFKFGYLHGMIDTINKEGGTDL